MKYILMVILFSFVLGFCAYAAGFRLNLTPSLPCGVYREVAGVPERGDLVAFCLESPVWSALAEERGYLGPGSCQSGLRPLLKRLVGMPGDTVLVKEAGIAVASSHMFCVWPAPERRKDSEGRPLPPRSLRPGVIPPDMGLALAPHPGSFDSRFFGLVPLASMTRVEPVFTF